MDKQFEQYFRDTLIKFNGITAKVYMVTNLGIGIKVESTENEFYEKDGEYFIPFTAGIIFQILQRPKPKTVTNGYDWD